MSGVRAANKDVMRLELDRRRLIWRKLPTSDGLWRVCLPICRVRSFFHFEPVSLRESGRSTGESGNYGLP